MSIITTLANIGRGIEKIAVGTAETVYNLGKYGFDSPREIVRMGNEKRAEADHKFLYQVIFFHAGESRLKAIEKLKNGYPQEYNDNLARINYDNRRFNIPEMLPVTIEEKIQ